LNKKKSCFCNG